MRLGMLTASLPQLSLGEIAAWAGEAGYQALEVAAWPDTGGRDFEAAHLPVTGFDRRAADETRALTAARTSRSSSRTPSPRSTPR